MYNVASRTKTIEDKANKMRSFQPLKTQYVVYDAQAPKDCLLDEVLAVDIETDNLSFIKPKILTIGLAFKDKAIVIDVTTSTREQVIEFLEWVNTAKQVVFHNGFFDITVIKLCYNFDIKYTHDTMLMHSMFFDNNTKVNSIGKKAGQGLKTLASRYLGEEWEGYDKQIHTNIKLALKELNYTIRQQNKINKKEGLEQRETKKMADATFALAGIPTLLKYNAIDCHATLALFNVFKEHIFEKDQDTFALYKKQIELVKVYSNATVHGITVDKKALLEMIAKEEQALLNMKLSFDFNPSSPKQVKDKFKVASTEKSVLKVLKDTNKKLSVLPENIDPKTFLPKGLDKVLSYRKKVSFVGKLNEILNNLDEHNKIHPHYRINSATNGRMSCSMPNIHGLPKKGIRHIFIAPNEDTCIVQADYNGCEMRVCALLANDEVLQAAIDSTVLDIHCGTAKQMYPDEWVEVDIFDGKNLLEIEDYAERNEALKRANEDIRNKAKAINFAIIYGGSAKHFSKTLDISIQEAERTLEAWKKAYPKSAKFLQKANDEWLKPNLKLPSGRKVLTLEGAYMAPNYLVAGFASDILQCKVLEVLEKTKHLKRNFLVSVHDSMYFECAIQDVEEFKNIVKTTMEDITNLYKGASKFKTDIESGKSFAH